MEESHAQTNHDSQEWRFEIHFSRRSVRLGIGNKRLCCPEADSCAANSANRQLDYWLGNWKIGAEGSSGNAHSTVSLSLDKCLVVENWDGGRGHYGQNVFGYSADDKSWYGMFADNEGRVHIFTLARSSPARRNLKAQVTDPMEKAY